MKTCGYCGRENLDNAPSCEECGTSDFETQEAAQSQIQVAGTGQSVDADERELSSIPKTSPNGLLVGWEVRYLTVAVSNEGVAEMDGVARTVFIPKDEIVRIELVRGSGAERPFVQGTLGAVLLIIGLFSLRFVWLRLINGGKLYFVQAGLVLLLFTGAWLLWEVWSQRVYLLITTQSSAKRKIVFHGAVKSRQLSEFINSANRNFGYLIQPRLRDG